MEVKEGMGKVDPPHPHRPRVVFLLLTQPTL